MEKLRRLLAIIMAVTLAMSIMLVATSCGDDNGGDGGEGSGNEGGGNTDGENGGNSGNSGTPCIHFDLDRDNKCDACGADYTEPDPRVEFTVTVVDEAGAPMVGVDVSILSNGDNAGGGKTDSSGKVTLTALPGEYMVMVDGLPEYWYAGVSDINLSKDNKAFTVTAFNNTPDGSAAHPFFIGDDEATFAIPKDASYHFTVKGMNRTLKVYNSEAKVIFDGNEYFANADGVIEVFIAGTSDTYALTPFVIVNLSESENDVRVYFESPKGSNANPYEASLNTQITVSVPKEETVYYKWVSTGAGILTLTTESKGSYVMLQKLFPTINTGYTQGAESIYMYVSEGDEIMIPVASTLQGDTNDVVFTLTLSGATDTEPMPVGPGKITVKFSTGATYYYVYRGEGANASLRAANVSVTVNGTEISPEGGYVRFALVEGDLISITNTADGNEDITLNVLLDE